MLETSAVSFAGEVRRLGEQALGSAEAADFALALAGGLLGAATAALALGLLGDVLRRRSTASPGGVMPLGASASFSLRDGRLVPRDGPARRLLKALGRDDYEEAAEQVRTVEGPRDLAGALRSLERSGNAFTALAEDDDGDAWWVQGAPEAGEARISVGPADDLRREAARLRSEVAKLTEERDRAKEALERAPVMTWRRDGDGEITWANELYRRISIRRQGEAAPGGRFETPSGPIPDLQLGEAGRPRLGTVSAGGPVPKGTPDGSEQRRAVFDAVSGDRLWFDISETPSAFGGTLGYGVDAAKTVNAEAALRRFVETLTETFAHLNVGLAIFDRERRLGLFNPALSEMMQLDPAWLASRPRLSEVLERLREARMLPDPSDFLAWRDRMLELFDADEGRRAGLEELWELSGEVQIRVIARPHPQGAVAFLFEDVSEAAQLERRWMTETETRRATMDRLEEAVAAFGPDGAARFANPAFERLWGFRPGAEGEPRMLSEAIARFRAATVATTAWTGLAAFFEAGEQREPWAEKLMMRDGRHVRARTAPLPDGSILVAFADVTDSVRARNALRDRNAALESAEEIRGALIDQLSRRLRTPLDTISGLGRMLREGPDNTNSRERHALGILEAASEVQEVVSGVADLAAAQADAVALHRAPVDLRAALEDALKRARPFAARRGVGLGIDAVEEAGIVAGDAARVRQIVFNLLTDALHRTPPGANVRAGAARREDIVEIWTDEPAPRDGTATVGRGLAHSLVRRFAALHGGEVRVETFEAEAERGEPSAEQALPFVEGGQATTRLRVTCVLPGSMSDEDAGEADALVEA